MSDETTHSGITLGKGTGFTITIGLFIAALGLPYIIGQEKEQFNGRITTVEITTSENTEQIAYDRGRADRKLEDEAQHQELLRTIAILEERLFNINKYECRLQILEQPGSLN